jgi:hypothetical protein
MVPGITTCAVKSPPVGLDPDAAVPVYAMPDRARVMVTPVFVCVKLNGEPGGVQTLPTVLLVHCAAVPTPGKIFCKSNITLPVGTKKVAKLATEIGPVVAAPRRF